MNISRFLRTYDYDCRLKSVFSEFGPKVIAESLIEALSAEDQVFCAEVMTLSRDFYIGSDLNESEKSNYISALHETHFFDILESFLYSTHMISRLSAIYQFGKFTQYEMVGKLEKAFETTYIGRDPMSVDRCLFELNWLKSKKFTNYISKIWQDETDIDFFTVAFLFQSENFDLARDVMEKFYTHELYPNDLRTIADNEAIIEVFQTFWEFCHNLNAADNSAIWSGSEWRSVYLYFLKNRTILKPGIAHDFPAVRNQIFQVRNGS